MANGPTRFGQPHPETVALLEKLGSANSHNCRSDQCVVAPEATIYERPLTPRRAGREGRARQFAAVLGFKAAVYLADVPARRRTGASDRPVRVIGVSCVAAARLFSPPPALRPDLRSPICPLDHPAIHTATALRRSRRPARSRPNSLLPRGGLGYLPSLLEHLGINADSQALVFSKTSFQAAKISPRNPRAIYFNDDVAVGWVRGGDGIEVAALDPKQGIVFYTLPAPSSGTPALHPPAKSACTATRAPRRSACPACSSARSSRTRPACPTASAPSSPTTAPVRRSLGRLVRQRARAASSATAPTPSRPIPPSRTLLAAEAPSEPHHPAPAIQSAAISRPPATSSR